MREQELASALRECLEIMHYYHKVEQGHEDSCENPECCGHCKAVKSANEALAT